MLTTQDILKSMIEMERPEMLALKVGREVVTELLRHPRPQSSGPVQQLSSIRGRLRLSIPAIKRAPQTAARVETKLAAQPGVRTVSANPTTGTVLVHYDERLASAETLERTAELALAASRQVPLDKQYGWPQLEAMPALDVPEIVLAAIGAN